MRSNKSDSNFFAFLLAQGALIASEPDVLSPAATIRAHAKKCTNGSALSQRAKSYRGATNSLSSKDSLFFKGELGSTRLGTKRARGYSANRIWYRGDKGSLNSHHSGLFKGRPESTPSNIGVDDMFASVTLWVTSLCRKWLKVSG